MNINVYGVKKDEKGAPVLCVKEAHDAVNHVLNCPSLIADQINDIFDAKNLAEEHVFLLSLDSACHPIGAFEVSHGVINASLLQPREIFVRACLSGASTIVIAHNHPSGDVTPSKADTDVTKIMIQMGKMMKINLSDHIIIGKSFFSYRENCCEMFGES